MRNRTTLNYIVIGVAAALVAAVIFVRSVAAEAAYPVENANRTFLVRVTHRVAGMFRAAEAAAENARLRREVAALAVLRSDVDRLEEENGRLRRALAYAERHRGEWVAAGVLSHGGGAAGVMSSLRVDKGLLDGVRKDAVAVVPEGLVGVVTDVSPHTATVLTLADPSVRVDCEVEVAGSPPARGVLSGGGDDLLALRYFRSAAEVPPRSRVLTSGRGGVFPRGIEIGTFNGVRADANGLLQEGEVQPGVVFSTLEDVFIRREK